MTFLQRGLIYLLSGAVLSAGIAAYYLHTKNVALSTRVESLVAQVDTVVSVNSRMQEAVDLLSRQQDLLEEVFAKADEREDLINDAREAFLASSKKAEESDETVKDFFDYPIPDNIIGLLRRQINSGDKDKGTPPSESPTGEGMRDTPP